MEGVVHILFFQGECPEAAVSEPIMRIFRRLHTAITIQNDPDYIFSNGSVKVLLYEFLILPMEPFYHVIIYYGQPLC